MNFSPELLPALAERIGWALLHSLWQGAIVTVLLCFALRLLRGRSAAARHAMCLLALLAITAGAAVTLLRAPRAVTRPAASFQMPTAPDPTRPLRMESRASSDFAAISVSLPAELGTRTPTLTPTTWRGWLQLSLPWASALWVAGVLLLSLRHAGGWWRVRTLRRSGKAADSALQRAFERVTAQFGLSHSVRLSQSLEAGVPMLIGLFKPVVLLPARVLTGLSPAEVEAILAHELAHLVRRDAWSNLAQVAIETLFFYHPAIWWIGRRARDERELAADDLALRVCTDRRLYAGALVRLAESQGAPTFAVAANGGNLLHRIRRIVQPTPLTPAPVGWSIALPAMLLSGALAAVWVTPADADDVKAVAQTDTAAAVSPSDARPAAQPSIDTAALQADVFQLDDPAKRAAAIERIRAAMASDNVDEARAGITTFTKLAPIEFDKASFRPIVRALIKSPDAKTRAAAAGAFTMTGADPEDVETVLALADDPAPEIRESLTYIIVQLTKRDLTGKPASDAILKLMNNLPQDSRSVAHAMWGVKFSPEIEARVLEFCRDIPQAGGIGYNFFYGALSTQANKSEASCKRLIELLAHEDITNIAGRSAWGLQQGVARPQYGLVADAMLKVIESRSEGYLRGNALRCLQTYGDAAQAPAIKALLAKPALTAELRKSLEQTLAAFEARPSANAPAPSEKPVVVTPAAAPGAAPVAAAATVQISADGTLKWNGQELSIEALSAELKVRAKQSATYAVVVRAGKDVDYKSVLKVLNLCREANIQNVAFANDAAPATAGAEEQRVIQMLEKNRQAARLRAAQDRQHYSPEQLQEIETLYQVANTKGKRSTEARASLKQLLEKYDKANRTGCATLYLGQASEGAERLEYLTRAVEKFSDCYYFNGCQVGGYGRYVLALTLWEKGDQEKARALIGELKTTLKDATDHRGRPITELAEEAEKHFAAAAGTATP